MISPFYQQALDSGAFKSWLNPTNEGQGRLSVYCGKPLRAVARLVYGLACMTLISTGGALYHASKSIDCTIMSKSQAELKEKSWDHLVAASHDAYMAAKMAAFIFLQIGNLNSPAPSSDRALMGVGITVLAAKTLLTSLQFTLNPNSFK